MGFTPQYPIVNPLINGVRYDYSSILIMPGGLPMVGIQEISYKNTRNPANVFGSLPQRLGTTTGQVTAEASITMLLLEYQNLITQLNALAASQFGAGPFSGFMLACFDIPVQYQYGAGPLIQDVIKGCSIKEADRSFKQGPDALVVKIELNPAYVIENGSVPLPVLAAPNSFIPG